MDYLAKSFEKTTAGERVPVPPPKYLPVRGPALWKKMPYDNKQPLQPRPRIDSTFTCKELGESLYESYPNKNFELWESVPPPSATYDSLHDPYLRFFFRSTRVFRNLLHRGLVSEDGLVKMKLPEYNAYRRYLYRLWVFHVNQLIREENEEEDKCFDQVYEAFEKGDPYFDDLFDDDDEFDVDVFLAQLTVTLYEGEDIDTRNPLIRSLVRWLQYEGRLQNNYAENYSVIRGWLRHQLRNKFMLEKKINMRRSRDNYLRDRWEAMKVNSKNTYETVLQIQEKQRTEFQMRSAMRLSKARKMWARSDPRNKKKSPRFKDNLTTKTPIDKKVFNYSKNINLGEDWEDQTRNSEELEKETESPASKIEEKDEQQQELIMAKEIRDSNQDTAHMKKTPIRSANNAIISRKKRGGFAPKGKDFWHAQSQKTTHKQNHTLANTPHKRNPSPQMADSKESSTTKNHQLNTPPSGKTQMDQRKISPDSKRVEGQLSKGIKSVKPSPGAQPRKTPVEQRSQGPRKTPLVKSKSKEKTDIKKEDLPGTDTKTAKRLETSVDKNQLSKAIKSVKPSPSTQPRKTPEDKRGQEPRKIPLVKSKSKEKTDIKKEHLPGTDTKTAKRRSNEDVHESLPEFKTKKEPETSVEKNEGNSVLSQEEYKDDFESSEQEHSLSEPFDDSDPQDSRREELQSFKSGEEEEVSTDASIEAPRHLEALRTGEAETPDSISTTGEQESRGEGERTMDELSTSGKSLSMSTESLNTKNVVPDSDLQDSRREELQSFKSGEEEEVSTDASIEAPRHLEALRTGKAETPDSISTTWEQESRGEGERTTDESSTSGKSSYMSTESLNTKIVVPDGMDDTLKSLLTKESILETLSSGENIEVPPFEVFESSQTNEGMESDSDLSMRVLNQLDGHIQRLDSYLNREKISESKSHHEKEAVQKLLIKDREVDS